MSAAPIPVPGEPYARNGGLDVIIGPPPPRDPDPLDSVADPIGKPVVWCSPTGFERDRATGERTRYRVVGGRKLGHAIPGSTVSDASLDRLFVPIVREDDWYRWRYVRAGRPLAVKWVTTTTLWLD